MKDDPRQKTLFDAFPAPKTKRTDVDTHTVDYTGFSLGQGVGYRKVIVACKMCGMNSVFHEGSTFDTWMHCEEISLNLKGQPKRKRVRWCDNKAKAK